MSDHSIIVYNERVKLNAAFLNGLAIAVFAIGGFSPVVSGVFNESGPTGLTVFMGFICFSASCGLHFLGRLILGRLKHDVS